MGFNHYLPKYYMKMQTTCCFELKSLSPLIFIQIPGLVLTLSHETPALYEISFHGHCRIETPNTYFLLRVRVDGHLIIANYLSSDMKNEEGVDGAYMATDKQTPLSTFQCGKTDWIYLSAGVHTIDVVAKTTNFVRIHGGLLKIKLTPFHHGSDINMQLMTPPQISRI